MVDAERARHQPRGGGLRAPAPTRRLGPGGGGPRRRSARPGGSDPGAFILVSVAKKKKRKAAPGDIATNRQASFRFNLLEKFEAGIVLQGSEVKSLRNMHIAPYKPARENHEPERPRKLLLHRREIERLLEASAEKGLTIVPTRIYFNGPRAKVELALAKGKDMYDKRRSIKDRDVKREIDRAMSERY